MNTTKQHLVLHRTEEEQEELNKKLNDVILKLELIHFGEKLRDIYWKVKSLQECWNLLEFEAEKKFLKFSVNDLNFPILIDPQRLKEALQTAYRDVEKLRIQRINDWELERTLIGLTFQYLGVIEQPE